MKTRRRRPKKSFDELISGYYGKGPGEARTIEEVLADYYGRPRREAHATQAATA